MAVSGSDIATFLGQPADADLVALAGVHVAQVRAMVRAYTRGNGFLTDEDSNAELAAVITTATARLVTNPDQAKRIELGNFSITPTVFQGFNLAELAVLNRYRKRAS